MEEWAQPIVEKARELTGLGLCDRCLGRMFAKIGTNMTNDYRGRAIRAALKESGTDSVAEEFCPLCENVFDSMQRFAEEIAEKVNSVESDNFLVGCKVEPETRSREKEIWERYGLEDIESIKTELNREVGKLALPLIRRPVEFKKPQVVACVDTRFADVELDIKPVFIAGRYNKLSREIPQTVWPCRVCHGKGCPRCHGTGKMYQTSVQEIIGDIAMGMAGGTAHSFHGMGREDIDACMLGEGRPFILQIDDPKVRDIDLDELELRANESDLAKYHNLHFVEREMVQAYKAADSDKTYHVTVKAEGNINKERAVEVALAFENVVINQRTPARVEHRRADLVRKREIYWVKIEFTGEDTFDLTLKTQSGTYVKEFVSGDDGRTTPSFSGELGVQCRVQTLDVLSIDYTE